MLAFHAMLDHSTPCLSPCCTGYCFLSFCQDCSCSPRMMHTLGLADDSKIFKRKRSPHCHENLHYVGDVKSFTPNERANRWSGDSSITSRKTSGPNLGAILVRNFIGFVHDEIQLAVRHIAQCGHFPIALTGSVLVQR
jgi:hypothetical protein